MKKNTFIIFVIIFIIIVCLFIKNTLTKDNGIHYLVDIDNVDNNLIHNNNKLTDISEKCLKISKVNILDKCSHNFKPYGFTLLYLLSESHFSLHTWPEKNKIRIDLFSCSDKKDCQLGIQYLKTQFSNSNIYIQKVIR
jgi:S-adenosylmethionine decarboxylase proenzyme